MPVLRKDPPDQTVPQFVVLDLVPEHPELSCLIVYRMISALI